MSENQRPSQPSKVHGQLAYDGYTPRVSGSLSKPQGGYQPTTGSGPSSPPTSVPNQPSSVQPPKR